MIKHKMGCHFDSIMDQLINDGYGFYQVEENIITPLLNAFDSNQIEDRFENAKIGQGFHKKIVTNVRSDSISWIEDWSSEYLNPYFKFLSELQNTLNQTCMIALRRFEGHFALFEIGARYQKHIDNAQGQNRRVISVILYLSNSGGGELVLFDPLNRHQRIATIKPQIGKLVIFESGRIWHEVLASHTARKSLTGWFCDDEL